MDPSYSPGDSTGRLGLHRGPHERPLGPTTSLSSSEGGTERVLLVIDSAGTIFATWLHSTMPAFAADYTVGPDASPWGRTGRNPAP